ncbi:Aste57867_9297 [Aphanomyces stellatus]|uniref:Aste57867_9297 protein n=1 Tax=Aphanomyces stellatus TaxID=120398 RepID=A0A485KMU6_9STRA|nr:hypothetical protein As57867_009261 [Aphanomyces stellatus]VFT86179.1 Aste57867_9297 [Aphanomyces stellatus]
MTPSPAVAIWTAFFYLSLAIQRRIALTVTETVTPTLAAAPSMATTTTTTATDPHALYLVCLTRPWARVPSTANSFWTLTLHVALADGTTTPLVDASRIASSIVVAHTLSVPLDDDMADLNVVRVGNVLVAVNGTDVVDEPEAALTMLDAAAVAASPTCPAMLLFARHESFMDVCRVAAAVAVASGHIADVVVGDTTWFVNDHGVVFADHHHTIDDDGDDILSLWPLDVNQAARPSYMDSFVAMRRATCPRTCVLAQAVEGLIDAVWQHYCDVVLMEALERDLHIPHLAHLNVREHARYMLADIRVVSMPWPFEVVWQPRHGLTCRPIISSLSNDDDGGMGLAVVHTSTHPRVVVGDILVAINRVFLTPSATAVRKKVARAAQHTGRAHPMSFLFLRHQYHKLEPAAIAAPCPAWSIWDDDTLLDPVESYVHSRLPPRVAKLAELFDASDAWDCVSCVAGRDGISPPVVCYRHRPTRRLHCDHPLHVLAAPHVQRTHTRLRGTCRRVTRAWQRRCVVDATVPRIVDAVLDALVAQALDVLQQHVLRPSVVAFADAAVAGLCDNVVADALATVDAMFMASLPRFRHLHRVDDDVALPSTAFDPKWEWDRWAHPVPLPASNNHEPTTETGNSEPTIDTDDEQTIQCDHDDQTVHSEQTIDEGTTGDAVQAGWADPPNDSQVVLADDLNHDTNDTNDVTTVLETMLQAVVASLNEPTTTVPSTEDAQTSHYVVVVTHPTRAMVDDDHVMRPLDELVNQSTRGPRRRDDVTIGRSDVDEPTTPTPPDQPLEEHASMADERAMETKKGQVTETPPLVETVLPTYAVATASGVATRWVLPRLRLDRMRPPPTTAQRRLRQLKHKKQTAAAMCIQSAVRRFLAQQYVRRKRQRMHKRWAMRNTMSPFVNERVPAPHVQLPSLVTPGAHKVSPLHKNFREEEDDGTVHSGLTERCVLGGATQRHGLRRRCREHELMRELRVLNQALDLKALKKDRSMHLPHLRKPTAPVPPPPPPRRRAKDRCWNVEFCET